MSQQSTLCLLGCGNLGTAILKSLLTSPTQLFTNYIACIKSSSSEDRLKAQFSDHKNLQISTNDNVTAVKNADVIILALDPSIIAAGLSEPGLVDALGSKLLISVAAGWTVENLANALGPSPKASIIRTLPNIAALVSQSLTAIEVDPSKPPSQNDLDLTTQIFTSIGQTQTVPPSLMDATTAVAGSTPAMFAVLVDAMIDASVAVGVPRPMATNMILQSMRGSAAIMQSGVSPGELRDQGTSPEGCTIGGLMVLEERGVRGGVGRAVREAVSIARAMDGSGHPNDTR